MTEQPYTPDFTKTGDVFVSRDGTEWQFRNDAKCATQPITLSRIKNTSDSSSFWTSGRYVTDRTEHDLDIVSQYTPVAPERDVPQEIPQWCRFAFKELRDNGFISSPHSKECLTSDAVCRIIARHAPKVETDAEGNASPNTEAKRATSNPPQDPPRPPKQLPQSDASGVERWDVRSVITLGDEPPYVIEKCRSGQFVKAADHDRVVADLQRKLQIREAEIGIGGSPPPYPTWMQQVESRDATIAELNKDAKEDHAVILAYQRRAEAAEAEVARLKSERDAALKWFPVHEQLDELLGVEGPFEVDADTHFGLWKSKVETAEAKCAELEKEIESVRSQYLPHASLTIACQDYEAKLAAANEKCENARRTIAELTNSVVAATERADAAEAEVARLHKIVGDCELVAFDNCNPPQLWSWIGDWEGGAAEPLQRIKNAKDAVKEIADLTAQLAAANERAENAEARCAELQSKLTGCEKAIDELKKSYEAAEAKCAEQKRFAESMLAQAMDSQAQLAAANGSLADMTNKFMDAHKELAAATERVAALEKERDGLRDECERLRDVAEGF